MQTDSPTRDISDSWKATAGTIIALCLAACTALTAIVTAAQFFDPKWTNKLEDSMAQLANVEAIHAYLGDLSSPSIRSILNKYDGDVSDIRAFTNYDNFWT